MAKRITFIHDSIRSRLGYSAEQSVKEILSDWKRRTTTVCKPCWELKYCPYGPLVEQLPLLPTPLDEYESHNSYLRNCLETGTIGQISPLSDDARERLTLILRDGNFARSVAWSKVQNEIYFERYDSTDDALADMAKPLPPLEVYRVPFEQQLDTPSDADLPLDLETRVVDKIESIRIAAREAIETGVEDNRQPLDDARRAMFQSQLDNFNKDDHPPHIPEIFSNASCNVFGHICPVFFAAESLTETNEAGAADVTSHLQ